MTAMETLTHEHRLIEAALDAMLVWTDEVARRDPAGNKLELRLFLTFLRDFVDECHHAKEEQVLFPAMKAGGMADPVIVMLMEHEQGRTLTAALAGFARQSSPWSEEDRAEVVDLALTYVAMMRQHICKEDTMLYPMAEARLAADAQDGLNGKLEHFEEVETGRSRHVLLHRLAESLIAAHRPHRSSALPLTDWSPSC